MSLRQLYEKKLPYIITGIVIVLVGFIAVHSMFNQPLRFRLNSALNAVLPLNSLQKDFIASYTPGIEQEFATAATRSNVSKVLQLSKKLPNGVNTYGKNGESALLVAVTNTNPDFVKVLLKAGANPDGGPDRAPLHEAVREAPGSVLTTILLQAGANPNALYAGEPPIAEAALMGHSHQIELLLQHNADIEASRAGTEHTALIIAASADHWQTVLFLLEKGASMWNIPANGFSMPTFAEDSRVRPDSPEGQALQTVVEKIRAEKYPWPPPSPIEIRALREEGKDLIKPVN